MSECGGTGVGVGTSNTIEYTHGFSSSRAYAEKVIVMCEQKSYEAVEIHSDETKIFIFNRQQEIKVTPLGEVSTRGLNQKELRELENMMMSIGLGGGA